MIRWPGGSEVDRAVRAWTDRARRDHPEILAAGYFGSYARGDWGVGSDVDLIVILSESSEPFQRRPLAFDLLDLPVPADLLVYTLAEWRRMLAEGNQFARRTQTDTIWVHGSPL